MAIRPKKLPRDPAARALEIVKLATGQTEIAAEPEKNPHAVALGKLGGAKGGRARAERMTARQRTIAARKAAQSRWATRKAKR